MHRLSWHVVAITALMVVLALGLRWLGDPNPTTVLTIVFAGIGGLWLRAERQAAVTNAKIDANTHTTEAINDKAIVAATQATIAARQATETQGTIDALANGEVQTTIRHELRAVLREAMPAMVAAEVARQTGDLDIRVQSAVRAVLSEEGIVCTRGDGAKGGRA